LQGFSHRSHDASAHRHVLVPGLGVDADVARLDGAVKDAEDLGVAVRVAVEGHAALHLPPHLAVIRDRHLVRCHALLAVPPALRHHAGNRLHLLRVKLHPLPDIVVPGAPPLGGVEPDARVPLDIVAVVPPGRRELGKLARRRVGDGVGALLARRGDQAAPRRLGHLAGVQGTVPDADALDPSVGVLVVGLVLEEGDVGWVEGKAVIVVGVAHGAAVAIDVEGDLVLGGARHANLVEAPGVDVLGALLHVAGVEGEEAVAEVEAIVPPPARVEDAAPPPDKVEADLDHDRVGAILVDAPKRVEHQAPIVVDPVAIVEVEGVHAPHRLQLGPHGLRLEVIEQLVVEESLLAGLLADEGAHAHRGEAVPRLGEDADVASDDGVVKDVDHLGVAVAVALKHGAALHVEPAHAVLGHHGLVRRDPLVVVAASLRHHASDAVHKAHVNLDPLRLVAVPRAPGRGGAEAPRVALGPRAGVVVEARDPHARVGGDECDGLVARLGDFGELALALRGTLLVRQHPVPHGDALDVARRVLIVGAVEELERGGRGLEALVEGRHPPRALVAVEVEVDHAASTARHHKVVVDIGQDALVALHHRALGYHLKLLVDVESVPTPRVRPHDLAPPVRLVKPRLDEHRPVGWVDAPALVQHQPLPPESPTGSTSPRPKGRRGWGPWWPT